MRFDEAPDLTPPGMLARGSEKKVMHSRLRIGDIEVVASRPQHGPPGIQGRVPAALGTKRAEAGRLFQRARRERAGADADRQYLLLAKLSRE